MPNQDIARPAVSLIFYTRNQAGQLGDCLDHIARVDSPLSWEFVVVDNGPMDDTSRILSAFAAKVPFPVKVLYEAEPGKCRGSNREIGVSRGDIFAFFDDDVYISPNHIDRVQEIFADSRIGFAGGQVELFDPNDYPLSIKASCESFGVILARYTCGGSCRGWCDIYRAAFSVGSLVQAIERDR